MHTKVKNTPRLRLADLLRRRKMTLEQFIAEFGTHSYGSLVERCQALGVVPPEESEFTAIMPLPATCQQDGVVVIEPTAEPINDNTSLVKHDVLEWHDDPTKKHRSKKNNQAKQDGKP